MTRRIAAVLPWEALDSRGRPTVGCRVELDDGTTGRVVVPSGASTGRHEARERRDGGDRYGGWGVAGAVAAVADELAAVAIGRDARDQSGLDAALRAADGTDHLERLGANAVLAVSLATWVAGHDDRAAGPVRLPMPMFNIVSGGAHADRAIDIQDILVIPVAASSAAEAIEWGSRVRTRATGLAADAGLAVAGVADEGGIGARFPSNRAAIDLVARAIDAAGLAGRVAIAIDVAATQLARAVDDGWRYALAGEGRDLAPEEWADELRAWVATYPVVSLEDPFGEDDWDSWAAFAPTVPGVQLVGDDLFATTTARVRRGREAGAADAVLVKPNQIGTVSDALDVVEYARGAGMTTVTSARSGDTEDSWLVDLACWWGSDQLKVGSFHRSERTAKWNRMLELEADPGIATSFGEGIGR